MTPNSLPALDPIRDFVLRFSSIQDVQFSAVPYSLNSDRGIAYLLLVASINQGTSAESIRDLMRTLYDHLGEDLFHFHRLSPEKYQPVFEQIKLPGWKLWTELPAVLSSAARFVESAEQHGGLVARGRKQKDTLSATEKISTGIYYMGKNPNGARKKTWMFLRWMVRPAPDIGVWHGPLQPADLRVPLDVNTGKAFFDLAKVPVIQEYITDEKIQFVWEDPTTMASISGNVESVTAIARLLFPQDPARVDYAFFCYGRRFGRGEDQHRCWAIVHCENCPIRSIIGCRGK